MCINYPKYTTVSFLISFCVILSITPSLVSSEALKINRSMATEEQCRSWGFDSTTLACSTCELLNEHFTSKSIDGTSSLNDECQSCCQKWLDTIKGSGSFNKKYKSAKLSIDTMFLSMHLKELQDFLDNDFDNLVKEKGNVLTLEKKSSKMMHYGMSSSDIKPAMLYFYDTIYDGANPVEEVALDSWKKDDLRDLLRNLLPDAK